MRKTYLFLTAAASPAKPLRVSSPIDGKPATTLFEPAGRCGRFALIRATPETGRTHQIRLHAAQNGFAVAADALYEKPVTPLPRLMLHAASLELRHPQTGQPLRLDVPTPATFSTPDWLTAAEEFRSLLFDSTDTNACRLVSGAADGFPNAMVDRYGERFLVQWYAHPNPALREAFRDQKLVERSMEKQPTGETATPESRFEIVENGLKFLISLDAGYSTGLFLDQRENRRRLLTSDLRGKTVLNTFAYTCAFSVAAARAGATVTSLDLSKRYLDWGRDNFRLNDINPEAHDFIYGDCFDWLARLAKKGRSFDVVLLDPPTFSTVKKGRPFSAEKDYAKLVALAEPLVKAGGTLFCSTNARSLSPQRFMDAVQRGTPRARRMEFATQPFDFRVAVGEKPYLKTVWAELD
ncbi:MAG: class I SAM-dependent methyltransferase [Verrucomicrobia bacterium]|nr:class I SAM-dependent methyltransferase [Verrucomicrobiota bacterium]